MELQIQIPLNTRTEQTRNTSMNMNIQLQHSLLHIILEITTFVSRTRRGRRDGRVLPISAYSYKPAAPCLGTSINQNPIIPHIAYTSRLRCEQTYTNLKVPYNPFSFKAMLPTRFPTPKSGFESPIRAKQVSEISSRRILVPFASGIREKEKCEDRRFLGTDAYARVVVPERRKSLCSK